MTGHKDCHPNTGIKVTVSLAKNLGSLVRVAIVCAVIYGVVVWKGTTSQYDDVTEFAEKACVDEISQRFNAATVKVYAVKKNSNGYIVRATITLARGNTAKAYCLTNTHGGVKDISLEER
jgi:nitrogen fixation-related uncharacterized protein